MGLYGVMRTGVSGMQAQSGKLSTVADNIANVGTAGYKRASMNFATQVLDNTAGQYTSGGVTMNSHRAVSDQGTLRATNSATDLAINGNGFFVVQNNAGDYFLTRDGGFFVDSEGRLVNSSGELLLGFESADGSQSIANGFNGLSAIHVGQDQLLAQPTTQGALQANLPSNDPVVAGANLPSANAGSAEYSGKTSMVVYDSLGNERYLDVYFAKSGAEEWEVAVYDASTADATSGTFPYTSAALVTETLDFDATNGYLTSGSASSVSFTVPGGEAMTLDLSGMSQLGSDYSVISAESNGTAPASVERVEIGTDGVVYGIYQNGFTTEIAQIALARVPSPDKLQAISGNNFAVTIDSGDVLVGRPEDQGFGALVAGALEESNVDLASELTVMIESQRSYTANSKVFQTGSELMDVLVTLKR